MRFLVYNIRYGTGDRKPLLPITGYHRKTGGNLREITEFIRPLDPDVIGLVEVDNGSFRHPECQAECIARELGHFHSFQSKYKKAGLLSRLPVTRQQGNAFLAKNSLNDIRFHYFQRGVKRLVIELETESMVFFLVHLAITFHARQSQLQELYRLVKNTRKPVIVAGDFNTRWGDREIELFLGATGLIQPDAARSPTFPSWAPRRQLDFILHSPSIQADRFWVPQVTHSDHLPLLMDFSLREGAPVGMGETM